MSFLRVSKQPAPDEDNLDFQEIYPRLKEIFHLLDTVSVELQEKNNRLKWNDESASWKKKKTLKCFETFPLFSQLCKKYSENPDKNDFECYQTGHKGVISADC